MSDWNEAKMYVLEEFKHLRARANEQEVRLREVERSIVMLKVRAGVIASIGALVASVGVGLVIKFFGG